MKVTYRRAAVTPPLRAARPRARGSYESSSPGSASRSRSASAFRPRCGRRPAPTSTSGVTREETGRKNKRLAEARASVASAESNQRRRSWRALAPPLKGSSAAAHCLLEWDSCIAGSEASGNCTSACGLGTDSQGSSGWILGLCRDWEDSHRATVCFPCRQNQGA